MRAAWTVYLKELRENFRDRRTLATALLFGPLGAPLLFVVLMNVTLERGAERAEEAVEVVVVGREHAPNLVAFLEQQGAAVETRTGASAANAGELVRRRQAALVLVVPADFGERLRAIHVGVAALVAEMGDAFPELKQQQAVDAMAEHVIRAGGRRRGWQTQQQQWLGRTLGQPRQLRTQLLHRIVADDLVQRAAEQAVCMRRQHGGVDAALDDAQFGLAQREQHSMRLDRGAELDLLAVAVGQLIGTGRLQLHERGRTLAAGSLRVPGSLRGKRACVRARDG